MLFPFRGTRLPRRRREVIFPDGFNPEEGKEYECNVRRTMTDVFHYEGEDFDVCYAQWNQAATFGDQMLRTFEPKPKLPSPLAEALRKAGLTQ